MELSTGNSQTVLHFFPSFSESFFFLFAYSVPAQDSLPVNCDLEDHSPTSQHDPSAGFFQKFESHAKPEQEEKKPSEDSLFQKTTKSKAESSDHAVNGEATPRSRTSRLQESRRSASEMPDELPEARRSSVSPQNEQQESDPIGLDDIAIEPVTETEEERTFQQPAVAATTGEPVIDSKNNEPAIASKTSESSIASKTSEPAIASKTSEPAIASKANESLLSSKTSESDIVSRTETKLETKVEALPQAKPVGQPETKFDVKPEVTAEVRAETKPKVRSERPAGGESDILREMRPSPVLRRRVSVGVHGFKDVGL